MKQLTIIGLMILQTFAGAHARNDSLLNTAITPRYAAFITKWDMVPSHNNMEAGVGLSTGPVSSMDDFAMTVHLKPDGKLEVSDKNSYDSMADVPYQAGDSIHVQIKANIVTEAYNVIINNRTTDPGNDIILALDYGTRNAPVDVIDNLGIIADQNGVAGSFVDVSHVTAGIDSSVNDLIWEITPLVQEYENFTATMDLIPSHSNLNGALGLSGLENYGWKSLSMIVRFHHDGYIDIHNGSSYAVFGDTVYYEALDTFHVSILGDCITQKYDVLLNDTILMAEDYSFRNSADKIRYSILKTQYSNNGTIGTAVIMKNFNIEETAALNENPHMARGFALHQNYPNPFNPTTTISYALLKQDHVTLAIYDMRGSRIKILIHEKQPAGSYSVHLNASDLATGFYIYQLRAGETVAYKKMLLLK